MKILINTWPAQISHARTHTTGAGPTQISHATTHTKGAGPTQICHATLFNIYHRVCSNMACSECSNMKIEYNMIKHDYSILLQHAKGKCYTNK